MITVYAGDWSRRLCNGCYGRLLSLYEIKAGTGADDERADELASALLLTVALDDQRQAGRLHRASDRRDERISSEAVRFIATAEHVAAQLQAVSQLEWSPAVIGLCKGVEAEVVSRILMPLADKTGAAELSADKNDKDIGRRTYSWKLASMGLPVLLVYLGFIGGNGSADVGPPLRDHAHWQWVMNAYTGGVLPDGFLDRWLPCGKAQMWMIVRSRPGLEQTRLAKTG